MPPHPAPGRRSPGRRPSDPPHARHEGRLAAAGLGPVAGVDEVGRGAWAGPVSVGVVVHPPGRRAPTGLRDSKELSEPRREALFPAVIAWCQAWAVGHAGPEECDELGMTAAQRLAARRAFAALPVAPGSALLDGSLDYLTGADGGPVAEVRTVVGGDATCVSVAAASVVAKVTRDRMMRAWSPAYPAFAFDRNKGYPSPVHRRAVAELGLTDLHRRSWSFADGLASPPSAGPGGR